MVVTRRGSHQESAGSKQDETTPVGVTIAFQQHRRLNKENMIRHEDEPTASSASVRNLANRKTPLSPIKHTRRSPRRRTRKITKPVSSWTVFWEGATLYLACLVLPALLGTLWHYLGDSFQQKHHHHLQLEEQVQQTTLYDSAAELVQSSLEYLCQEDINFNTDESWSAWLWSWSGSSSAASYLCPMIMPPPPPLEEPSLYSPDTSSFHDDVWMVALAALCLAALRLLLIQWIVTPLKSPDQLAAMVRCKSIHLLSADYSQTPAATPVSKRKARTAFLDPAAAVGSSVDKAAAAPTIPDLRIPVINKHHDDTNEAASELSDLGLGIDETEREDEEHVSAVLLGVAVTPATEGDALNMEEEEEEYWSHDDDNNDALVDEDEGVEPETYIWDDLAERLETYAASATTVVESEQPIVNSVYAAPRYATALFRLLYCTAASILAFYSFHDANFWPFFVGGKGSTANCWDLSGGLTVGMDSDFDHRNAVLKRYFLWQASYHWHSGAFHILSILLLMLHPPAGKVAAEYAASPTNSPTNAAQPSETTENAISSAPRHWRLGALKTNTSAYARSLMQHVLALSLISIAYVFSSLRRLSAIGMFAFDLSSWFLHLLQVCINAPDLEPDNRTKGKKRRNLHTLLSSWYRWLRLRLRHPLTISLIHRYLVLPSFCYTRLFVWPALWYSCMFESKHWLQQLEQTLWPGSAQQLKLIFHIWFGVLFYLTTVYFRRLIYHPHLRRIQKWFREQQVRGGEGGG